MTVDGPIANDTIDIEYDTLGHKSRMIDPDKGIWEYRHNALGELVCQRHETDSGTWDGQLILYDPRGRRTDVLSTCPEQRQREY